MDLEGNDDMLFSIPTSQDCQSDAWSDESEGEMFVASPEYEQIQRDLQSSPMLMGATDSEKSDELFDLQIEPDPPTTDIPRTSCATNVSRDRYALVLTTYDTY
jgi:hypothetical protein